MVSDLPCSSQTGKARPCFPYVAGVDADGLCCAIDTEGDERRRGELDADGWESVPASLRLFVAEAPAPTTRSPVERRGPEWHVLRVQAGFKGSALLQERENLVPHTGRGLVPIFSWNAEF